MKKNTGKKKEVDINEKYAKAAKNAGGGDFDKIELESGVNVIRIVELDFEETFVGFVPSTESKKRRVQLGTNKSEIYEKYPMLEGLEDVNIKHQYYFKAVEGKIIKKKLKEIDPKTKKNKIKVSVELDNEVKVFECGVQIFKQISALQQDDEYGDITAINIKIEKTGKGLETEYGVRPMKVSTPMPDDLEDNVDLSPFGKVTPPSEVAKIVGAEDAEAEEDEYDEMSLVKLQKTCKKRGIKFSHKDKEDKLRGLLRDVGVVLDDDDELEDDEEDEKPSKKSSKKKSKKSKDEDEELEDDEDEELEDDEDEELEDDEDEELEDDEDDDDELEDDEEDEKPSKKSSKKKSKKSKDDDDELEDDEEDEKPSKKSSKKKSKKSKDEDEELEDDEDEELEDDEDEELEDDEDDDDELDEDDDDELDEDDEKPSKKSSKKKSKDDEDDELEDDDEDDELEDDELEDDEEDEKPSKKSSKKKPVAAKKGKKK